MPRKSRHGGKRVGKPGQSYPNRSDLARFTPPSTQYGETAELVRSQQAVPAGPRSGPEPMTGDVDPRQATADYQMPRLGDPLRPSERPGEPLTAGIRSGAGPGPESLMMQPPVATAQDAAGPVAEDMQQLRGWMPLLELLASEPGTAPSTRRWVRELRAQMPPTDGAL